MIRSFIFLLTVFVFSATASSTPFSWGVIDESNPDEESKRFLAFHQFLADSQSNELKLKPFKNLETAKKGLELNEVQLLTLRPAEYLEIRKQPGMKAIAIFLFRDKPYHHSLFLARFKTKAKILTDFKGKRLGLGRANSLSTYQVPMRVLEQQKINPTTFFSKLATDLSHAKLELALVKGELDLVSVSDIVHDSLLRGQKIKESDLKIIHQSTPIPNEVLVVREQFLSSPPGKKLKDKLSELISNKTQLQKGLLPEPWSGVSEVSNTLFDTFESGLKSP